MKKIERRSVRRRREPTYLHHKGRDKAYCWVYDGDKRRQVFLGPYNSPESHRRFKEVRGQALLAEAHGAPLDLSKEKVAEGWCPTVADLVAEFLRQGERRYVKDGSPTAELGNYVDAARPLLKLYRDYPTKAFDFEKLEAVRADMVNSDLCRTNINRQVSRLRSMFKWGVTHRLDGVQLVPPTVHHELCAVPPLRPGQEGVREKPPVSAVEPKVVDRVLPHLPMQIADMVRLQLATGMRPGEVCQLRWKDIETEGEFWLYRPQKHKTQHLLKDRVVALGPTAQGILSQYRSLDRVRPLFTPLGAVMERNAKARAERQSKVPPSQRDRDRTARHDYGEAWTTTAYRRAIARACSWAKVKPFSPNQLRHTFATLAARDGATPDELAAMLGHSKIDTARHYVERGAQAAIAAVRRLGVG